MNGTMMAVVLASVFIRAGHSACADVANRCSSVSVAFCLGCGERAAVLQACPRAPPPLKAYRSWSFLLSLCA